MVHADSQNVDEVLRSLTKDKTDGVVFLATEYSHSPERISNNLKVPFVCIDRYFEEATFENINIANRQSHYMTIRHLMELGHRKIGYLSTTMETGALKNRREEFCRAMQRFDLEFSEKSVLYLSFLQDEAERELEQYIRKVGKLPTAFVACNDVIAVAVMKTLQRAGWKVPEDISVVGFDNSGICDMVNPGLTTIHADLERMGALAVERIVQMINTDEQSSLAITISTELICRETTARAKADT
jgi:DNA-binding LacI/PurR family transcriptional regulator